MENLSNYQVKNPKKILMHFKTLAKEKCLIAASFGENQSFLTAILSIDEKQKIIIIDCGPKEYLNKELLSLGIVHCKTDFGGIQVQFEGRGIKKAGEAGKPALSIKIPEKIYWLQRRQHYRVRSPRSKESFCSITFPDSDNNEKNETVNFKLFDLSATGFAIISETGGFSKYLTTETEFNNCKLVLNNTEPHIVSFIVRSNIPLNPNNPTKTQRIGCELINSNPKTESSFLSYMQEIQRELKKNFD